MEEVEIGGEEKATNLCDFDVVVLNINRNNKLTTKHDSPSFGQSGSDKDIGEQMKSSAARSSA